jgi:hypothetical protein
VSLCVLELCLLPSNREPLPHPTHTHAYARALQAFMSGDHTRAIRVSGTSVYCSLMRKTLGAKSKPLLGRLSNI